jgi:hypothetical protein
MTRSPVGVFVCLLGFLCTFSLMGCGGTETGNPVGPGGGGDGNAAKRLVQEICQQLTLCFGEEEEFTEEDCELALEGSETLGAAFGIEEEPTPGFDEVIDEVENSELSANEEALQECVEEIRSLTCEDLQEVEVDNEFRNVEQTIPEPPCSGVFSGP